MKKIVLYLTTALMLQAETISNSIGMEFVKIPNGSFMMGTKVPNCPKDDPLTEKNEREDCTENITRDERPYHKESISSFYMQTTEVVQYQWYKIMGNNPAHFKTEVLGYNSQNNPIENISWKDVKEFIRRLNSKEKTNIYRLPTEKEWEYVARAGSQDKWHFGNNKNQLKNYAWYGENSEKSTHPVAKKQPNSWGIYDMNGNVYEWTNSCYTQKYNQGCYVDYKILRGGSWSSDTFRTRAAFRYFNRPIKRYNDVGFRLVRSLR